MPAHVAILVLLIFPAIHWRGFFANLLFIPTFFPHVSSLNNVTWTLGWEWLFYVLMFRIFSNKHGLYAGMASVLLILILSSALYGESYLWGEWVGWRGVHIILLPEPGRFAGFFIGVIMAHLVSTESTKVLVQNSSRKMLPLALLGVVFGSLIWSMYAPQIASSYIFLNLYYLGVSIFFGGIVAYLATNNSAGFLNLILQTTFMRIVGQISYSFYLIHAVVTLPLSAAMVGSVNSFPEMCLHYIVGFLLTIIMATMTWYYFERPYFLAKERVS